MVECLTFVRYKGVVSGCEADVGDGDLVKFVRVGSILVVVVQRRVTKQWSS